MIIILTILASILTVQPAVETPAIKGARISLVPKPQAKLNVTIENRRASPLIEWRIGIAPRPGQGAIGYTGYGSIPPGERRTVLIALPNPQDVATGTLVFVAFEDGFHEGTAQAVADWRLAREERAKDLSYWLRVLGMMPRVSEPELRRYLAEHSVQRAGEVTRDPSGVSAKLQRVLQSHPAGADVWPALDRLRIETEAALARTTRESLDAAGGGVVDAVSSAVIAAQEQVEATTFMAAVENVGGRAIEALGFEEVDGVTNRPRGGQTADFCGSERLIHPKEIKEFFFGSEVNPNAPPVVRLTFVLFDDLSFEGSISARDGVLRHRETQADDYAYAIAVVRESAGVPPGELERFLVAKQAERARQLQSEGRRSDPYLIDQLLREAKGSPERFVAGAKVRAEHMEQQRQRLLRHKTAAAAPRR
jgi:hypothetical protein